MKIAIIGTGISGMVAAYLLQPIHDITVYEAQSRIGGHTHTFLVKLPAGNFPVDLGFIVFNDETYPNFCHLLKKLKVPTQKSEMSFGIKDELTGLEFATHSLKGWFAQKKQILQKNIYQIIRDAWRFSHHAPNLSEQADENLTLGDYLERHAYSDTFCKHFLIPMAAAIWSTDPKQILYFPAAYLARFFVNHRIHRYFDQPQWHTILGGSQEYVWRLTKRFQNKILTNTAIKRIKRTKSKVTLTLKDNSIKNYDKIIIATHSDQALKLISEPTAQEKEILGAIPYQKNHVVLHTDTTLLPKNPKAWASWNYHRLNHQHNQVALTYDLSRLQSITAPEHFLVTLNGHGIIDSNKVLFERKFSHPVYSLQAFAAQKRFAEINGQNNTYFCGAYWRWGFHEDGVVSAIQAVKTIGVQENKRIEEVFKKL